jgi:hypothetical protein
MLTDHAVHYEQHARFAEHRYQSVIINGSGARQPRVRNSKTLN